MLNLNIKSNTNIVLSKFNNIDDVFLVNIYENIKVGKIFVY